MQEDRYYTHLAAAYVQEKPGVMPQLTADEIIQRGLSAGLHLLDKAKLETMFLAAGAKNLECDSALNHLIAVIACR
jgi:hypothetical protein